MKLSRTIIFLAAALAGTGAFAQSRSGGNTSSATNYAAFSTFVTDRNIFDPNRQPHSTSPRSTRSRTTRTRSTSAPSFSLVGTMAYEKGFFAFFSGNSDELKRTMSAPGKIAGYMVTEITPGRAVLVSADQKQKIELKVGEVMRQESGKWELASPDEVPASGAAAAENTGSGDSNRNDSGSVPAAGEANDVLKRLMQKREQENQ